MLNQTQKLILRATFDVIFSTIEENVPIKIGLLALDALYDESIYKQHKTKFIKWQIIDCIDQLRKINQHPYPQNRSAGDPRIQQTPGWVAFRGKNSAEIFREEQGILGLTEANDATSTITREDIITHLRQTVEHYRSKLKNKISEQTIAPNSPGAAVLSAREDLELEVALTFGHAFAEFVDDMKILLTSEKKVGGDSLYYCIPVLRAIRTNELKKLFAHPEQYGVADLPVDYVRTYIAEHPILLSANRLTVLARAIEKQPTTEPPASFSTQVTSIIKNYYAEGYWYGAGDIYRLLTKQIRENIDGHTCQPQYPFLKENNFEQSFKTVFRQAVSKNLISVIPINLVKVADLDSRGQPNKISLLDSRWIGLMIIPPDPEKKTTLKVLLIDSLGNGLNKDIEISLQVLIEHSANPKWQAIGQLIKLINEVLNLPKVNAQIIVTGLKQEEDQADCGPLVVHNLITMVKEGQIKPVANITDLRQVHGNLLAEARNSGDNEAVRPAAATELPVKVISTPFWSVPLEVKPVDEELFSRFVISMVEVLDAHLKSFGNYHQDAALSFTRPLLRAIRKDQLEEFFLNPLNTYGISKTVGEFLKKELENHHYLFRAKDLNSASKIEEKLATWETFNEFRKIWPEPQEEGNCCVM